MRLCGIAITGTALMLAAALASSEPLTRTDRQGAVTVMVTLQAAPAAGTPLVARVVLDTHSADLDGVRFDRAVVLRAAGGDIEPASVEASGGGHHREATLTFPPPRAGEDVRIAVRGVGGIAERIFEWPLASR